MQGRATVAVDQLDPQPDVTLLRELHRVAQQVLQDLRDAQAVSHQDALDVLAHLDREGYFLLSSQRRELGFELLQEQGEVEGLRVQDGEAGLGPGEVQELVDDGVEALGRAMHRRCPGALLRPELAVEQKLAQAQDAREWGA